MMEKHNVVRWFRSGDKIQRIVFIQGQVVVKCPENIYWNLASNWK